MSTYEYGLDGLRRRATVVEYAVNDTQHATPLSTAITDYVVEGQNVIQEVTRTGENQTISSVTDCVLDSRVQGRITKEYDAEGPTGLETAKWLLCDGLGTVLAEVGEPQPVKVGGEIPMPNPQHGATYFSDTLPSAVAAAMPGSSLTVPSSLCPGNMTPITAAGVAPAGSRTTGISTGR